MLTLLRNPLVIWLGVSNAAGFVFQFKGQTLTTAANAALLINASTISVAIASRLVFRERFGRLKVIAVIVGTLGVFFVKVFYSLIGGLADAVATIPANLGEALGGWAETWGVAGG